MAAPLGNKNAAKAKIWRSAIERALERRTKSRLDGLREIDALAEKLIELVAAGDLPALREFGDRMDGKPHQSMDVSYSEQTLEELPDGELLSIARRGSNGTAETSSGEKEPAELH